jgi:hypothetical protein
MESNTRPALVIIIDYSSAAASSRIKAVHYFKPGSGRRLHAAEIVNINVTLKNNM